jgi:glycosyltransferase involved in cell wall biosynthesis
VPIIAPRLAVIREVIVEAAASLYGPDQGGLATGHNPDDIADAIVGLERDAARRAHIGSQARGFVTENYSEVATLLAHDKLYRRLVSRT